MIQSSFNIISQKLYSLNKRSLAFGVIAILGTFQILAPHKKPTYAQVVPVPANTQDRVNIIFDLGGVMFTTSKAVQRAKAMPVILRNPSLAYHLLKIDIKEALLDILDQIPAITTDKVYNQNKAMPQILNDWMTGNRTLEELQILAQKEVELSDYPTSVKKLLLTIAYCMFDTEFITKTQIPVKCMVKLIKDLKDAGYGVYILSNWDPYSFVVLKKNHPKIFDNCDEIMISGEEKLSKPNAKIFRHFLSTYNLNAQTCIFIDDEPHNITAAQEFGITSIMHTNPTNTFKELSKHNILKLKKFKQKHSRLKKTTRKHSHKKTQKHGA